MEAVEIEMGPKSDPVTAAYKHWKEAVEDWDDDYAIFEAEMITAEKATKKSPHI